MIEEFAEGGHPSRLTSSGPATGARRPVTEGTFAGQREKSPGENVGSQGGGQNDGEISRNDAKVKAEEGNSRKERKEREKIRF